MTTVGEVTLNVKIIGAIVHPALVLVSGWNNPSFDCPIITGCTYLGLSRTSSTSENH
jgi:hypothetical protein